MNTLKITKKEDYTIIQIQRGKVNAINQSMVSEMRDIFADLKKDSSVHGVILTGIPSFFSAGLDVIELYDYDEDQMKTFFTDFSLLHEELVRFTKPLICAITGYCPAGGTVLAVAADYRVMADNPKYSIGLNEMSVNIQITQNLIEAYAYWLGRSLANRFVLAGKLLNPQEALEHHLVDQICPESEVLPLAEKQMNRYLRADKDIFMNTKAKLRKNWLDRLTHQTEELDKALDIWWKPEVRLKIKQLIDSFSNKK